MPVIFKHNPGKQKDNNHTNKYDRYALERIERKVSKLTDLVYSLLRR